MSPRPREEITRWKYQHTNPHNIFLTPHPPHHNFLYHITAHHTIPPTNHYEPDNTIPHTSLHTTPHNPSRRKLLQRRSAYAYIYIKATQTMLNLFTTIHHPFHSRNVNMPCHNASKTRPKQARLTKQSHQSHKNRANPIHKRQRNANQTRYQTTMHAFNLFFCSTPIPPSNTRSHHTVMRTQRDCPPTSPA